MKNSLAKSADKRVVWLSLIIFAVIIGRSGGQGPCYRYREAIDDPLGLQLSQVCYVYGEYSIRGLKVHIPSVRKMFNTGVKRLSGKDDLKEAWRYFIHDDDVVALTFTGVGGKALGVNRDVSAALLQSLYSAGFKPENIMLVGLDKRPDEAAGTRECRYGWQKEQADFGSGSDHLALWLKEVTAIINVPSLMDDNIIGLRGALANLSWPLIKSPARLYKYMARPHKNQGDPFIAEIYDLPQIRGKVRLHITNALRILYQGGPDVKQVYVQERGALIFSTDPVALDRVGLKLLRLARLERIMPSDVDVNLMAAYLETAQAVGLGYSDLNLIEFKKIPHDKN